MTAKRFTRIICSNDEYTGSLYCNDEPLKIEEVCTLLNELYEENQELRLQLNQCSDQRNEFHRGARENANRVGKLKKENEQLKEQNADWETAFDNCKHYKEAYGTEIVKIKQTIKDMMENERTELGRSVLKQLWEAIR